MSSCCKAFLLDFHAGLFLLDVFLQTVTVIFFDFSVDNSFWQLSERDNSGQTWVVDLRQDESLLPDVLEQLELG